MTRWSRAHPALVGWVAAVVAWGTYALYELQVRQVEMPLVWDDRGYWDAASSIRNPFLLSGYIEPLRGVAFPMIIRWLASGFGLVEPGPRGVAVMLTLICIPLLTAVIAPSIARSLGSRTRVGVVRILVLNLAVFAFWRNDTLRILSDIPSLTAFAGAVALLARLATDRRQAARHVVIGLGAAAGFLLAVSANTRPAYLSAVAAALVLLPLLRWGSSWRRTAGIAAALAVGLVIGFAPQMTVNRYQDAGWSIVPRKSETLVQLQLKAGLTNQRYDTYIGPVAGYPQAQMNYDNAMNVGDIDPAAVDSLSSFAGAALSHPLPVAETLARHGFNGLDIRWPGTYVDDVHAPTLVTQIPNFAVLTLAAGVLLIRSWRWWRTRRSAEGTWVERRQPVRIWFGLVLVAAVAQVVVSAMETRFLLPLHLFLLAVVALSARTDDLPRRASLRAVATVAAVAVVAMSVAFSSSVFATLKTPVPEAGSAPAP